jgi:hypothetical protein
VTFSLHLEFTVNLVTETVNAYSQLGVTIWSYPHSRNYMSYCACLNLIFGTLWFLVVARVREVVFDKDYPYLG